MADNSRTNYGLEIAGYIFEIASHIADSLRANFTGIGNTQCGDFYMNQSRDLLRRHLEIIRPSDKTIIQEKYTDARVTRTKLEGAGGFRLKRFFTAMEYRRHCRRVYKTVEEASNRAIDADLMNQIDEAMHETESTSESLQPTHGNPSSDSHEVLSMLSDTSIGDPDQIDVQAYRSQITGGTAIVLGSHRQDTSTQHIVATFSAAVFSNPAHTA